jgi:hypothetical protein
MEPSHYNNLLIYLTTNNYPLEFNNHQQKQLQNQSKHYTVKHNLLYKKDRNQANLLIRVVQQYEMESVLYMFHNDPTAAHASKERMMDKMKKRFFWPQMFQNIEAYVKSCDACQRRGKSKRQEPLHPIPIGSPFHQIGIDYVGPLNKTTNGNKYIIVAMDYMTKWPEAKPVKEATAQETVAFVYEDIICRHGCPGKILTDRGTHFNNQLLKGLMQKFEITHLMSTPYHPQTNGLVERFNRTLIESLARTASKHLNDWDKFIAPTLFAYRTSTHTTTKISPFFLVYGRESKLPTDSTKIEEETHLAEYIDKQIDQLPITRNIVRQQIQEEQQKQKDHHDKKLKRKTEFHIGDKVLYYRAILDKQWSEKLSPKWKGPYYIHNVIGNGAYKLRELSGKVLKTPVNGTYLKIYKDRSNWQPLVIIQ